RASLGHRDLATRPGVGMLDRPARSRVLRPSRLEEVKNVLRAQCRPKSEELMIRIGEGSTPGFGPLADATVIAAIGTIANFESARPSSPTWDGHRSGRNQEPPLIEVVLPLRAFVQRSTSSIWSSAVRFGKRTAHGLISMNACSRGCAPTMKLHKLTRGRSG